MSLWLQGNCAEDLVCANVVNPPIHFDDIWGAFLSIVQAVSFDGHFEPVTRALQSEENYTALTVIYFCLISFFCRFVFFFLGVAIITNAFRKARAQVIQTPRPESHSYSHPNHNPPAAQLNLAFANPILRRVDDFSFQSSVCFRVPPAAPEVAVLICLIWS
jgi:hypothetical protein